MAIVAALIDALNALLIVYCPGLSPFLATLSTFFIGSSIERIDTDGGGSITYRRMTQQYHDLAVGNLGGVPLPIVIAAVLLLGYFLFFERTIFGKRIHAIGLNPQVARAVGPLSVLAIDRLRHDLRAGWRDPGSDAGAALYPKPVKTNATGGGRQ